MTALVLLEWLVEAHPEYIDGVRELTERSQVELVGGPFYEAILAGIPSHDRIGQIAAATLLSSGRLDAGRVQSAAEAKS